MKRGEMMPHPSRSHALWLPTSLALALAAGVSIFVPAGVRAASAISESVAAPAALPDTVPSPSAVRAYVDSVARAALASGPGAGLTIGVVRGADTLVWRGWGKANVELDVPAGPGTVYRIGSVTKQFTAALVMREVQAGRLSLDDPLSKYVPDYDTHGKSVTLRELLRHTAGVPNYTANPEFEKQERLDLSDQEVLAMATRDSLDFDPGTRWSYSNTGYYLLGLVLEKVTGRPYAELVDDSLAAPLGLEHTLYCWREPVVPGRAEGYAAEDSLPGRGKLDHRVLVNAQPLSMGPPFSAGALCSTAGDLVRWTSLLHAGKVVSLGSFRQMTTPDTLPDGLSTHYGFGLVVGSLGRHRFAWHNGGINGFLTSLARFPDDDLTVVVLANSTSVSPDRLLNEISRYALGVPTLPTKTLPLPRGLAARVTGTYRLVNGHTVEVTAKGDSLMARTTRPEPLPLEYRGGAEHGEALFVVPGGSGVSIVFHLPAGGRAPARRMDVHTGIGRIDALRVAEKP
jgi:D-alanyl-D-alanine carboxypeptidase